MEADHARQELAQEMVQCKEVLEAQRERISDTAENLRTVEAELAEANSTISTLQATVDRLRGTGDLLNKFSLQHARFSN